MPELAGQRISGTALSERDCFQRAIFHLAGLRDCLRGIALLRNDMRWLLPVRITEQLEDSVKKMINRGGPPLLILPERRR